MIARARALDKRYFGVVEAIVEEVEGNPKGEGRVKLKFHWFDGNTVTDWVRVRQLYAGDGYGAFFIPEKDTEVLVSFVHGDLRRPIVLGGLYNGKDKPPTKRTKQDDHKLIRTKYGHQIDLNDSSGHEAIAITTNNGHQLTLSDEKALLTLATESGLKATLDQNANVVTVTTPGGDQVVIDGDSKTITLSSATVVLDATNVQLGGSSAAHPVLLGDIFLALFNAHTHLVFGVVPTTPPIPPALPTALSLITKTS